MKKLKDDMDKFMEDALKAEEEICELLTAQKQTTVEAETQIIELQKVIEQLQNKSTSTTSTQTTLCKTTKETSIQTTTDTKNTFSQTECNGADGEETENYDNIKETKSEITTTVKSTQCNIAEIPHEGREKPGLKITCKRKWNPKKNHRNHYKEVFKSKQTNCKIAISKSSDLVNNFHVEIVSDYDEDPSCIAEIEECPIKSVQPPEASTISPGEAVQAPTYEPLVDEIARTNSYDYSKKKLIIADEYSNGFLRVLRRITDGSKQRILDEVGRHLAVNPRENTVLKTIQTSNITEPIQCIPDSSSFLEDRSTLVMNV
ncbi:hypothetical protein JTB14_028825 [Gonioctena quinquepunctata]|nr:hypothetical protein JTB14_028825 [Gonioctena quinquepunctata]